MLRVMTAYLAATLLAFQPPTTQVPLDVQLPAYLKALAYDRSLTVADGQLAVGVVFDPADERSLSAKDRLLEIHRELTRLRVKGGRVALVPIAYDSDSALTSAGVKVLLVAPLPASSLERLARLGASSDLLTLATDVADVDRGLAMGMEMEGGRPRFVVNLGAAVAAGSSFESSFLTLCRIVEK
jgi:hypothetical protein